MSTQNFTRKQPVRANLRRAAILEFVKTQISCRNNFWQTTICRIAKFGDDLKTQPSCYILKIFSSMVSTLSFDLDFQHFSVYLFIVFWS